MDVYTIICYELKLWIYTIKVLVLQKLKYYVVDTFTFTTDWDGVF